jgi:hypothetical protein
MGPTLVAPLSSLGTTSTAANDDWLFWDPVKSDWSSRSSPTAGSKGSDKIYVREVAMKSAPSINS